MYPSVYYSVGAVAQGLGDRGQGGTAIFFVEVHQEMVHLKVC